MCIRDSDGDVLVFSATGLPSGLSIDSVTGEISGTVDTVETAQVTVTVSDGELSDSSTFTWEIVAAPDPGALVCSVDNGVLTWTDIGANGYFVRSVVDGTETFLEMVVGTSLTLTSPAEAYRIRAFIGGQTINSELCDGNPDFEPPVDPPAPPVDPPAPPVDPGALCLLYTSPSPRDATLSRMPSSA